MFCSVIIPTIGRPSLAKAVQSALGQQVAGGEFEVVVVNDSGRPLPDADWQASPAVRVVETQRRDRCVARNTGAAVATGDYFCFLDDDDWLLPGALAALKDVALKDVAGETAVWVYGGVQFVDEQGRLLGKLNLGKPGNCLVEAASAVWIPLQASLIRAEAFFAAGGFDPQTPVNEDLDLCRRMAFAGAFANTEALVASILRGTSWDRSTNAALGLGLNRRGRERILARRGALGRLRDSAGESGFYHGRILHTYLGSVVYNLRERRLWTAVSRGLFAGAAFLLSGRRLFKADYWRALHTDTVTHELISEPSPAFSSVAAWLH
jgi:glycosyltransferase involved in cell wall biosynthesis